MIPKKKKINQQSSVKLPDNPLNNLSVNLEVLPYQVLDLLKKFLDPNEPLLIRENYRSRIMDIKNACFDALMTHDREKTKEWYERKEK
jgi:hypothetical protein